MKYTFSNIASAVKRYINAYDFILFAFVCLIICVTSMLFDTGANVLLLFAGVIVFFIVQYIKYDIFSADFRIFFIAGLISGSLAFLSGKYKVILSSDNLEELTYLFFILSLVSAQIRFKENKFFVNPVFILSIVIFLLIILISPVFAFLFLLTVLLFEFVSGSKKYLLLYSAIFIVFISSMFYTKNYLFQRISYAISSQSENFNLLIKKCSILEINIFIPELYYFMSDIIYRNLIAVVLDRTGIVGSIFFIFIVTVYFLYVIAALKNPINQSESKFMLYFSITLWLIIFSGFAASFGMIFPFYDGSFICNSIFGLLFFVLTGIVFKRLKQNNLPKEPSRNNYNKYKIIVLLISGVIFLKIIVQYIYVRLL